MKDWMYNTYIAHRGYHNETFPENSIGAFKRAMENGFGMEFDVRLLKDDTLVIMHDDNLKRMVGKDVNLSNLTYLDIKDFTLLGTEEKIPLFKEVLELVGGRVPLMIEFKNDTLSNRLEELSYELLKDYKGEYSVQSFNPKSVNWFRKNAPHVIRGQLYDNFLKRNFIQNIFYKNKLSNYITKPTYHIFSIETLDTKEVQKMVRDKKNVFAYTAKDEKTFIKTKKLNIPTCFEGFDPRRIDDI